MTTVAVVGLGYIGLPTAAMLATHGCEVIGVDIDAGVVDAVNRRQVPVVEPGLRELVAEAVGSGKLVAQAHMPEADAFIIAVPTAIAEDKAPDLSAVKAACMAIARVLRKDNLVVLESTVSPGTTEGLVAASLETSGLRAGVDFHLAHCPERVLPGRILREIVESDRVVGGTTPPAAEEAAALYRMFVKGKFHLTEAMTAEVVKLSENAFRDVNIAFATELARICERLGVDAWKAIELANRHSRVDILNPGPGVGGHCIPVDPWFLVHAAPELATLMRAARHVNDSQPALVAQIVLETLEGIPAPKATLLGATYKPNVTDTRDSPTRSVAAALERAGVTVAVHDPHATSFEQPLVDLSAALDHSDIAVLLVEHADYQTLDPADLASRMRSKRLLDTKHFFDPAPWTEAGFAVRVLGGRRET